VSSPNWVEVECLEPGRPLPLVIRPAVRDLNLVEWGRANKDFIEERLLAHGGILFRGFEIGQEPEFERFIRAVAGEPLAYRDSATPRTKVHGHIYTSTDYPATQRIELHNECSYARSWPLKIFFHHVTPAASGGETPLADCRRVYERIEPRARARLMEKGLTYVRNYGAGLGLSWQAALGVTGRAEAEARCRGAGIGFEWRGPDRLHTRQTRPAAATHPATRELVWFNQATAFHLSTLQPAVREALLAEFAEDELPKNVHYGDGSPLEPEVLGRLREAYAAEAVVFPWQAGDILMLDNMLVAHGREPYAGARRVLVGMAGPVSRDGLDS
jgi:alpha-ketoglutarate-dependent taurine dioxygenase